LDLQGTHIPVEQVVLGVSDNPKALMVLTYVYPYQRDNFLTI